MKLEALIIAYQQHVVTWQMFIDMMMEIISMRRLLMNRHLDEINRQLVLIQFDLAPHLFAMHLRTPKECWMKTRSSDWWDRIVQKHFTHDDWIETFRMSKGTFERLCEIVRPFMAPDPDFVREPLELNKRVAVAVYKLASCCENRVVANVFGIHKSTVVKYVRMFCETLVEHVLNNVIKFPNETEAMEIARRFQIKTQFPQVMGAIDGTHIPITAPSDGCRDFMNWKMWASYVLQAVVDDKLQFRDISCKVPGSAHDANVLKQSSLYKHYEKLPKAPKVLTYEIETTNGIQVVQKSVPLLILGDPAYPLTPWLMKGFTGRCTCTEESFNVYMNSARNVVEVAFERLKGRWRMLQKKMDVHYTLAPYIIATCCILHNIVEDANDDFNYKWADAVAGHERIYPQPRQNFCTVMDTNASETRQAILHYLEQNYPLRVSSYRD